MKKLVALLALALIAACGSAPEGPAVVLCPGVDVDVGQRQACPASWHPPMRALAANAMRKLPERLTVTKIRLPDGDSGWRFDAWVDYEVVERIETGWGGGYEMTLVFLWRGEPQFCSGRCRVFAPGALEVEPLIAVEAARLLGGDLSIEWEPTVSPQPVQGT